MVYTKKEQPKSLIRDDSPKRTSTKERPDKSPKKNPKESSSRVYRKSPARGETSKSPSRLKKSPPASPVRVGRPKSPARKSPSRKSPVRVTRPKSPARKSPTQKSPVRVGRPKSPGRKSPSRKSPLQKSPVRKSSPARTLPARKPIAEVSTSISKSTASKPKTRKPVIDVESDSDNADLLYHSEKPKAAVRGRARRLDSDKISPKVILENIKQSVDREIGSYIGVVRRSLPKSQPREVERIVHLQNEPLIKKLTEFSDEDDLPISERVKPVETKISETRVFEANRKLGLTGAFGALLAICMSPLLPIILYISCNTTHCSLIKLPNLERYKYLSTFFDKNTFFIYAGYILMVAILNAIPVGGPKINGMPNKQGKIIYIMNGLFIATVSFTTLFTLEFFNISIISIILQKYFQFMIAGIIIGCLLSVYLYVNSFFVPVSALNPLAITDSKLHNFNIGRVLNPRILKYLDVKLFLLRTLVLTTLLINFIFISKSLKFKEPVETSVLSIKLLQINPTLLVIAIMQTVYCLDFFIFEKAIVTTSTVQHQGVGYFMSISTFTGPFLIASATKFIYDYKVTLPVWQLTLSALLFCCGLFILRLSNSQKHAFRLNPYSPSISHLESLSTSQGKKLLISGFWGFVRHPNYLGDIMIQLSFILFVATKPPVIGFLVDILYLVYRALEDGLRCKHIYGTAWDRYCQRVKYVLIPKVY